MNKTSKVYKLPEEELKTWPEKGNGIEKLLHAFRPEPDPEDEEVFLNLINITLEPWQKEQIRTPELVCPRQEATLAVHWHPEFVPIPLIRERMAAMFPNVCNELCIPTQHNELLVLGGYAGVEIDCFSRAFNQKVQLLAHFKEDRIQDAVTFKQMLSHTYKYRSLQLYAFLEAISGGEILDHAAPQIRQAAHLSGADASVSRFSAFIARKLSSMIEKHQQTIPSSTLKNKLVRNYINSYRSLFGHVFIDRVQSFVREVKTVVKSEFSPQYYYLTSEMIEEIRGLGGCIVIPHPEQFWPILLADYDVDGYEVWNPQSQRYTEFLISVVDNHNRHRHSNRRKLLVFMGDDCHLGEKTLPPDVQDPLKAEREVGLQPAWEDMNICKRLISSMTGKLEVIQEYKERLEQ